MVWQRNTRFKLYDDNRLLLHLGISVCALLWSESQRLYLKPFLNMWLQHMSFLILSVTGSEVNDDQGCFHLFYLPWRTVNRGRIHASESFSLMKNKRKHIYHLPLSVPVDTVTFWWWLTASSLFGELWGFCKKINKIHSITILMLFWHLKWMYIINSDLEYENE